MAKGHDLESTVAKGAATSQYVINKSYQGSITKLLKNNNKRERGGQDDAK